jgi:hypothetical protein
VLGGLQSGTGVVTSVVAIWKDAVLSSVLSF